MRFINAIAAELWDEANLSLATGETTEEHVAIAVALFRVGEAVADAVEIWQHEERDRRLETLIAGMS